MRCVLILVLTFLYIHVLAQQPRLSGKILDSTTGLPVEGATVITRPSKQTAVTDVTGRFAFPKASQNIETIEISCIGYETKQLPSKEQVETIYLSHRQAQLSEVVLVANAGEQYKPISKLDIKMHGVNNSQEVLRIVPGVVIGQHQGGGKAEQVFLRGFDCDHGTDINLSVDGMPVNMVSHAHGQGYADSHFIIPEVIENVYFKKGPYYAEKGDFCTTGFVDFNTRNSLQEDVVKLEGGMFNTFRALGMFNLLDKQAAARQQSWYAASEYRYTDAYFDYPQHFNRFNFFTKYNGKLSAHTFLTLSASTFYSKWDASGQVPERAVKQGLIGFYGAIDPTEGGVTARTNVNAQLLTSCTNGDILKNQLYYSRYSFDLHTNFTFFLEDTLNGDQIRQQETRNIWGYNGSYTHVSYPGTATLTSEAGLNIRADQVFNTALTHTKDRFITLQQIKLGNIVQASFSPYITETIKLNERLSITGGLRLDEFFNQYKNKLESDSSFNGAGTYSASAVVLSPKLNIYYHVSDRMQLYLTSGKGFHSNDTRAVVVQKGLDILPAAYGADLGTVLKPAKNLLINAAAWYIYLQQEFVYSGDGGFVEASGRTARMGLDLSARYAPFPLLYIDADVNCAHGRFIDAAKHQDYIPLAPEWTSAGGITYTGRKGFNGSLRYRFIGDRPANETNSLTAEGYFITDAVVNYTRPHFEVSLTIANIFNRKWKETQFDTETRLRNEPAPVDEICFTPGTPFSARIGFSYNF